MDSNFENNILSKFKINTQSQKNNTCKAYCPCHDDKDASLSITFEPDRALMYCFAGCKLGDILANVGLTYADLFNDKNTKPIGIYQYRNLDGSLAHEKVKYQAPAPKNKTFSFRHLEDGKIIDKKSSYSIPYNLPDVVKAIKQSKPILYCEGEKDADTAKLLGYTSTTMGGASDWKDEYKNFFKGANIIQIPDKDNSGLNLAHNVTESLKSVAKTVKVVILPNTDKQIKDLTEWVEAGNSDLDSLISKSPELIDTNWLSNGIMSSTISGYDFKWNAQNLLVKIERLNDDFEGFIKVSDNGITILTSKINLMSTRSLHDLATRLTKNKKIDWDNLLSYITNRCSDALSDGGRTEDISIEPKLMRLEYLLDPILPLNEPTTIYTAGGKGKSTMADFFAVLIQYGYAAQGNLDLVPIQNNVLYLDWEADAETHRRYITAIKRGLGIIDHLAINYRHCDRPLSQIIDSIRSEIVEKNIGLVIIDSQMAATAVSNKGMNEAQIASEYYNLIHSLHCTTLTIDHITKQNMSSDNGTEMPYGSVVKYNRSRSQFELRMDDDFDDADHKEYSLVHRKFNLGRRLKPIGIAVDYENNYDELVSIKFSSCDIADNPNLSKTLPRKTRMIDAIKKAGGKLSIKDISLAIGEPDNIGKISVQLANDKKTFFKISEGTYGLVTKFT